MTDVYDRMLLWAPRLLSLALCLFLGLFALDAFSAGKPTHAAFADFAIHLIPAAAVLVLALLSWRSEWIGGFGFLALAAMYAAINANGRLDWTLAISGPLLIVGLLFLWSWMNRSQLRGA